LLATVDVLRQKNEDLERRGVATENSLTMEELAAENESLQVEVANMYTVQEQNKSLRRRLANLEVRTHARA
jgi:hypothetical protein